MANLEETFQTKVLDEAQPGQMCLRCVLWKVLGFHGSHRGIEANLERLRAVLEMSLYRTRKEVQCLAGWIVMLSRFVAQSGNKCLHFFKVLK